MESDRILGRRQAAGLDCAADDGFLGFGQCDLHGSVSCREAMLAGISRRGTAFGVGGVEGPGLPRRRGAPRNDGVVLGYLVLVGFGEVGDAGAVAGGLFDGEWAE